MQVQAIIQIGPKQFRVVPDQIIYTEKLSKTVAGSKVSFPNVLYFSDGEQTKIGKPHLKNVKVEASVLEEIKGPKIHGLKYKRRKGYQRRWGHRQRYHKIQIKSISA